MYTRETKQTEPSELQFGGEGLQSRASVGVPPRYVFGSGDRPFTTLNFKVTFFAC